MYSIKQWIKTLPLKSRKVIYDLARERMVAMRDENKYLTLEDALEWVRENETWGEV